MPITGTPAAAAATDTDPVGGPRNGTASPAELSTLAIACTAAGCGREFRAACTVAGAPMPLIPQAPMRPSAASRSSVGRTSCT